MILFLKENTSLQAMESLRDRLRFMGFESMVDMENNQRIIAITHGIDSRVRMELFRELPNVDRVIPYHDKFKFVGKEIRSKKSVIRVKDLDIGNNEFIVMAGPCSIENREQIFSIAKAVKQQGATVLRGGAFKPRTSPYDFQGLGEEGLQYMREAADTFGLSCVSEVMGAEDLSLVESYVDIIQLGARNMQNYSLLKALGKAKKPVLLKRGLSATYKEFLSAAEYIISAGNPQVMLCERGIRTFETYCRNTLDIAAVPILRELTHLPIIIDPSHGVGLRNAVPVMSRAALAVEADGLIVEVHTDPDKSISDAAQTISVETFGTMMKDLKKIGEALEFPVRV